MLIDDSKELEIELAKELVARDSQNPPGIETPVAEFIYEYLQSIGLKPEKHYYDKALGRFSVLVIGKDNPNLLINGHMDTVPINDINQWKYKPFGEVTGDKLYGRGSVDTKGQIACLLAAMTTQFNEKIGYVFNVEEETSLGGIASVMQLKEDRFKDVKYSISLEPTDGKIMIASKGQYAFEVTARGKTAHASQPESGDNAIYAISEAALKIRDYNEDLKKISHPLFTHATASVGVVGGGTVHNVVPDLAVMRVDRRVLPNEDPKKVEKEFRELMSPHEVKFINRVEACESSLESNIATEMQACLKEFKGDDALHGYGATTELSEISKSNIEGIIFGTGELAQCHKPNEYITLEQLRLGTRIFKKLLERWG